MDRVFLDEDRSIDASISSDVSFLSRKAHKNHKIDLHQIEHYFSLYLQEVKKDFCKIVATATLEFKAKIQAALSQDIHNRNRDLQIEQKRLRKLVISIMPEVQKFQQAYAHFRSKFPLLPRKKNEEKPPDHRRVKIIQIMEQMLQKENRKSTLALASRLKSPNISNAQTTMHSSKIQAHDKIIKAQFFYDRNRFEEAVSVLKQLVGQQQEAHSEAFFILANCYKCNDLLNQALLYYDKAIEIEQKANYLNNRGNCHLAMREYSKAFNDYRKAIEIQPQNDVFFANFGNACIHLKRFKDAVKSYNRAIQIQPLNDSFYNNRALAFIRLSDFQSALKDYAEAIYLNPLEHLYFKNRANIYIDLKQFSKAENDIKVALQIAPSRGEYHFLLGKCLYLKGLHRSALQPLKAAVELNPQKDSYKQFYEALRNEIYHYSKG